MCTRTPETLCVYACVRTIGEQLVKPAMKACAMELLGNYAVNVLMKIPLSNDK